MRLCLTLVDRVVRQGEDYISEAFYGGDTSALSSPIIMAILCKRIGIFCFCSKRLLMNLMIFASLSLLVTKHSRIDSLYNAAGRGT